METSINYYITCMSKYGDEFPVFVSNSNEEILKQKSNNKGQKNIFWFTKDIMTEVGEHIVIENYIGARVSSKRIK